MTRTRKKTRRMTWRTVRSRTLLRRDGLTSTVAGFIDEVPEDPAVARDDYRHVQLDSARGRNEQERVEDIVQRLKERHGRTAAARYNADSDSVPQRLLMPGVNDPSLWTVRVKVWLESRVSGCTD